MSGIYRVVLKVFSPSPLGGPTPLTRRAGLRAGPGPPRGAAAGTGRAVIQRWGSPVAQLGGEGVHACLAGGDLEHGDEGHVEAGGHPYAEEGGGGMERGT